uniref:Uncharacterized protein n=1 Tax=Arundo donax TaxID=35708 RepID=A0A0A8XXX8_ARUDO
MLRPRTDAMGSRRQANNAAATTRGISMAAASHPAVSDSMR